MKNKTNTQIIKDLMEQSDYGALAQLFVIDALAKHAALIADTPLKTLTRATKGQGQLIDPEAWIGVAKEIRDKLEAAYRPRKKKEA